MSKILVIEDDKPILHNILALLEAEDFEVIGAEDGYVGLRLATEQLPDLIICDVMMPDLDGYGVLTQLRQNPLTATIPFIFLTALADKADLRQGMELGADDYIAKPFTSVELLKAIATRLEKQTAINRQSEEKMQQLRSSIALSLPHELRTALSGIMGFSDIILAQWDSLEPSQILDMVGQIRVSGKRLYRLTINFLLYTDLHLIATDIAQVKALRKEQTYSVETIITYEAIQKANFTNREDDLQLNIQDADLRIGAKYLKKLIEELIDNAFKFSIAGTPVKISSWIENHTFILSISNLGRGMTSEQISAIGAYMQFDRQRYEQQGNGLGLFLAKTLIELHEGKLIIDSLPSKEITVRVSLPCLVNIS